LLGSNPKKKNPDATDEEKPEPPLVFQTVVRLNLADAAQNNSSSSGDTSSPGQMPGNGGNN
jgi:hypothetical protein